jgi:hypothetical protein
MGRRRYDPAAGFQARLRAGAINPATGSVGMTGHERFHVVQYPPRKLRPSNTVHSTANEIAVTRAILISHMSSSCVPVAMQAGFEHAGKP